MPQKYNDLQALRIMNERITLTERHWRPYHDDFEEIYKVYRFYSDTTSEVERGERSNIFVPYAFAQVETKIPRIVQAIFAYDPFFKAIGVGREDEPRARKVTELLQHQTKNEIDTFWSILTWLKECAIYGNSFMYVPWVKLEKMMKRKFARKIGQEVVGYDYIKKPVIKKDAPDLIPIDIFDCFPAPFGSTIQSMPYFIVRSEPTADQLKEMRDRRDENDKYIFKRDTINKILKRKSMGSLDETRRDRLDVAGLTPIGEDPTAPRYEMFTCWEDDWCIMTIENELIYNGETFFSEQEKPILMAVDIPIPHELFGFGQIKPILKLNYYANDILNLNLDNFFQIVNPGMTVLKSANLNMANFVNNPSGVHSVDVQGALAPIVRGDASINALNHIGLFERFMNLTTGSGDVIKGLQASKGQQTAREVMSLLEQAGFRFYLSTMIFKEYSLKRMLKMLLWRNQDFMPWEKMIRVHGEEMDYPILTPDDILGDFDFEIKISPIQGNKIAWFQSLIQFIDVLNKDQGAHPEIVRKVSQALGLDISETEMRNPGLEAAAMIAQAVSEGHLNPKTRNVDAQKAFIVLNAVFNKLAPQGSENATILNVRAKPSPEGTRTEAGEVGM